jgi:hypothetical protein
MSMPIDVAPQTDLRYPVGRFQPVADPTPADRETWITEIEQLPATLRDAVAGLNDEQLDTRYRPGGWTVRQVVHHLADSHLNCYQRYRLALTENAPVIKPYNEAAWAELPDAKSAPIEPSLSLLAGLHTRWVFLLRTLSEADRQLTFKHPERGEMRLDFTTGLYAWHCRHHLAHIRNLRERQGW